MELNIQLLSFPSVEPFRHGEIIGAIGCGLIVVLGIISSEFFIKDKKKLLFFSILLALASFVVLVVIPFNKLVVSASFILFSSAFSIILWLALFKVEKFSTNFIEFLSKNSLNLWISQHVLLWWPLAIFNLWEKVKFDLFVGAITAFAYTVFLIGVIILFNKVREHVLNLKN